MSLLLLTAVTLVPVYALAVAIIWALIRPRTARDWASFLFIFLALTAWLMVSLLLATGIDDASSVVSALNALEDVLGGAR